MWNAETKGTLQTTEEPSSGQPGMALSRKICTAFTPELLSLQVRSKMWQTGFILIAYLADVVSSSSFFIAFMAVLHDSHSPFGMLPFNGNLPPSRLPMSKTR